MKKWKYLGIFVLPLSVTFCFLSEGFYTFFPLVFFFGVLPALELFLPVNRNNFDEEQREIAENDPYYSFLLYLQLPIQWGFLFWFLTFVGSETNTISLVGKTIGMGIMCGVIGINLGHELGHRTNRVEQFIGELLLLSSLENHFLPYHNRGHHTNVATPEDPATARKNEWLYWFWFRSQIGSYVQAWQIELQRMKIMQLSAFSLQNKMVVYSLMHFCLLSGIYLVFGGITLLFFVAAALFGIALLETVNYIEHYGLVRKKNENGNYERVRRWHSWNSDHVIGRAVLFELSRHSDHHYKADRHYQVLESHEESPQMPTGYPGMMVLSLFPPVFFSVMNSRVESVKR